MAVTTSSPSADLSVRDTEATHANDETTPLLGSVTSSSATATLEDDGSSFSSTTRQVSSAPVLGWKRALSIMLSMEALIFLQASNMSGMTMTQSTIAQDLDAYESVLWFTGSYLITASSVAPLVGRLAMIFRPGELVLLSSFFFAIGAIVTSQASSFATLMLGRVLAGVGAGGVLTLWMVLVIQLTSKQRRGLFIGLGNAGFTVGLSTGAVVFGALLESIGWRAIFLAQFPIALLAGVGVYLSIPSFPEQESASKGKTIMQKLATLDYAGAAALASSIVVFLYSLSGVIKPWLILLSFVILLIFITIEYRFASSPIVPIPAMQNRGLLLSCLAQLGLMAARWTILYFAPIFVLAVRGLKPAVAGAVLIATNAGFGTGGLLTGWLHVRRPGSYWLPCIVSFVSFGLTLFGVSFVSNAATPAWLYLLLLFANGFCTGAALTYTLSHMLHLVDAELHYVATGLLGTFRGFAGSFGTAIGGGVFTRTLTDFLAAGLRRLDGTDVLTAAREYLIKKLVGSPALVFAGGLTLAEREIAVAGYEHALKVLYQSAAALCIVVVFIQAGTGWNPPEGVVPDEDEIDEVIAEHDGTMEA